MFASSTDYKWVPSDLQQAVDHTDLLRMLITFEGIDGSGKSTQARMLLDRLRAEGEDALLFREPGGARLSEHVRTLLLDPSLSIDPLAELLLFSAARAQLVVEQIQPALKQRRIVLCDRFFDSTMAYQGGARGVVPWEWLDELQRRVVRDLRPARTYLFVISPEDALPRRRRRARAEESTEEDRMEAAGLEFQTRVAEAYARIAASEPARVVTLDARGTEEELHEAVWVDFQALRRARTET